MIKAVKEKFLNLIKQQDGVALPAVLALFAIGSLIIVPSINYVATNLKAGTIALEEFKGILAADAGVEDALWKIKNDTPASFPYSYQITDINGLSVDITIDNIDAIASEEMGEPGHHAEWLVVVPSVTYDVDHYNYTLSVSNNGSGNISVYTILIDFPPGVGYVDDSTVSEILTGDPTTISGTPETGITLVWKGSSSMIHAGDTGEHYFELNGPPGIEGIEGYGFLEVQREDIDTVWICEIIPYSITAQAKDASGAVVATIRAGVWAGSQLDISCWQVIR